MPVSLFTHLDRHAGGRLVDNEMLRRMLAFDWSATAAGPLDGWPEALKGTVRTILAASAPMTLLIGPEGLVICNDAVMRMFGSRYDGAIGQSVMDVVPQAAAFYRDVITSCAVGEAPRYEDYPLKLHRDGKEETGWFDLNFSPILDEMGAVLGVLVISFETTERWKAVRALRRSEERLNLALDASGLVGVWELNFRTDRLVADERFASFFGFDPADVAQGIDRRRFFAGIHADDRDRVMLELERARRSAREFRSRHRVLDEGERVRWVAASGRPVARPGGASETFAGVVVDITDEVETEAALAESRFRFETLAETLPQIVWSCDGDGLHDYFSKRWYDFTGYPEGSVDHEAWTGLVHPDDWERVLARWSEALQAGQAYDIDYRFRHHSGEYRWLHVMALPYRDATGRISRWFGTSTDIHEAKLLGAERELVSRELDHRIKNIFALFGGLISLAIREEPGMKPFAERLREKVMALHEAHSFILSDTESQTRGRKGGSLHGLIARLLAPYGEHRYSIEGRDLLIGEGSATSLALLFHELATNAAKYGGLTADGSVNVRTDEQDGRLKIAWKEFTGKFAEVSPREDGFGSRLLRLTVEGQLRGTLVRHWEDDGLRIEIEAPLHTLSPPPVS